MTEPNIDLPLSSSCQHGTKALLFGVSKSGTIYAGWACPSSPDSQETECETEWVKSKDTKTVLSRELKVPHCLHGLPRSIGSGIRGRRRWAALFCGMDKQTPKDVQCEPIWLVATKPHLGQTLIDVVVDGSRHLLQDKHSSDGAPA